MTADKKQTPPASTPSSAKPESAQRKAWIKKTPVEVVLEQIKKQEERVNEMRQDLQAEEKELQKLKKAQTVLESN